MISKLFCCFFFFLRACVYVCVCMCRISIAEMLLTIQQKSSIQDRDIDNKGVVLTQRCIGAVSIRGVSFAYPVRPDALVCNNYNLDILPGQTVALVGASGCGKVLIHL